MLSNYHEVTSLQDTCGNPWILYPHMPSRCFMPKVEMINSYEAKPEEEVASPPPAKKQKMKNDEISKLKSDVEHLQESLATCGPHTACGMRCSALPLLDIATS